MSHIIMVTNALVVQLAVKTEDFDGCGLVDPIRELKIGLANDFLSTLSFLS